MQIWIYFVDRLILLSSESSSLMFTSSASRIFYRPSLFRTLGVGVRELLRPALEREAYNSSSLIALIELTNQKVGIVRCTTPCFRDRFVFRHPLLSWNGSISLKRVLYPLTLLMFFCCWWSPFQYLDSLNVFLNEGFRLSMDKEAKNRLYDLTFSSPCASSTDSIQCWSNYRRVRKPIIITI